MARIAATLVVAVLGTGCVVVQPAFYQYEGEPRSSQDEAVISIPDGNYSLFQSLDGTELANPFTTWNGGYAAVKQIHVLPGQHTVEGVAENLGVRARYRITRDFTAGKAYRLNPRIVPYGLQVSIEEVQ